MKTNRYLIKTQKVIAIALSLFVLVQCHKDTQTTIPNYESLTEIPIGFPSMPFPQDNEFTLDRWEMGKKLFYDPILSVDNTISCASCHKASLAFADDKAFSPGVKNRPGVRNAPSLANVGYHPYYLKEGSVPSLEMQVLVPVQEENEFAHDMLVITEILKSNSYYASMALKSYNREIDPYVIVRAISTFQRTLVSGNSPYDQYFYQGKSTALSESARRGLDLFNSSKTNCSSCHGGFNFSDYSFQNNGLATVYNDIGRKRLTGKAEDESLFKVPSLRNVELTAPYMHNGRFGTLLQVVEHYNSGGKNHFNKSKLIKPLNLSTQEKQDLVAFLKSLTDDDFVNNPLFRP